MSQTHDQNFKNLILDYPVQAIQFFAPQITLPQNDNVRAIPLRQEQLKEKLGDRYRELDTPIMLEWPDSDKKALIFLLEEESIAARFSITRLAHYCLDISELYKTTRLIPVVIFIKGGHYQQVLKLGTDHHTFLHFHYIACDLSTLNASEYLDSDNLVARLNLPLMCYNESQKVATYAQAIKGLMTIEQSITQQIKYIDFIDQYIELSTEEQTHYQTCYLKENSEGEQSMGHAQLLRDEGIQQGIKQGIQQGMQQGVQQGMQQGMQQGVQQGEVRLLLRLIKHKFGSIPVPIRKKVEQADTESLLLWADKILAVERVEDLFT